MHARASLSPSPLRLFNPDRPKGGAPSRRHPRNGTESGPYRISACVPLILNVKAD